MTGVKYTSHVDGDNLIIAKSQDVKSILDENKAWSNEIEQKGNLRRVASIPNIIVEKLMKEGIWWDKKALKKWLNNPDNALFRTDGRKRL